MAYEIDPIKTRQPNSDRLKVLYDALKEDGADVGDSWQFRDWMMADENNRKTVWQAFKDDGADVGEYDEFDTWLFDLGQQPTAATRPTAQQPTQRNMGTPGYVPNRFGIPTQQQGGMGPVADAAPHPMTPAQTQGQQYVTQQGQGEAYTPSARVKTPTAKRPKPMAPAPRAGQWSGAPMQQTPYAPTEEEGDLSFMPIEQGEDTKARYDAERRAVGGQGGQVQTMRRDIDSRLQEAYQRDLDNYGSELDKGGFWARMGRSMQAAEGNNPAANAVPSQLSDDTRDYQAAKHALDNSQKMIDEANAASRNGNFFAGAGRGMRDKFFDVSTWDFGITDLTDQAAIMRALEAYDNGEQLTESQQALLDAKAVELATTAYFGSELGRGYKAGQVTAEAIPFMFEMAINPAAGVGKGASKAMVRYALKKFGKEAIEKGGKRYIAKQAMKYGTRIVGDVIGASGMTATTGAARTAADALDRMAGNLHYDTDEQGNITFDGHTDAESWVKAFGKAFASTTIENYSEMLGNYFGPALGLLGKGASKVGKGIARTKAGAAVGRGIDKIGGAIETAYNSTLSKKIGLQAVGDFISKVPAGKVAGFLSELEKRAQWHGVMGEYAEEVAGGILNALVVGDQTLDTDKDTGVFNLDNNIDTFLGVALMGGFFSGAKTVGYGVERAHNARQFNKANRMGASAFGDGWADVQAAIESDPKAGAVAVLIDPNSTKEQREAALRYAAAVTARQGMEQGKAKRDAEGVQTQQEAAAEQSYNTGYEDANTDELRSDINMAYTDARQKLVGLIGEDAVNDIDSDPLAMQAQYDQDMTVDDNTKSAIADYVSAKSAWDGVQQRINDDAADRADQRRAEGERMAYKGKGDMQGAIRPLTINEDSSERDPETGERIKKTVYLVNGTIAIEPNGNGLSREGTDKTIYVYDPETGETHELDPFGGAGVLSVGDVVSMEDYLANNEQQSQAEVQQAAATAQGKVKENTPFETPQGRKGVVQSIEGDNAIVLFADGEMEQASMPLAEVQQYADALRRKEYEARHPQQTPAEQPQQPNTATEGQAPTAGQTAPQEGNNATAEQPQVEYPRDKQGNIDYDKIGDATTFATALGEEFGEDAPATLDDIIAEETAKMEKQNAVGKARIRKRLAMLEEAKAQLTQTEEAPAEAPTAEVEQPAQQTEEIEQPTAQTEVPDMSVDKASDARARGYRMQSGVRYDRQGATEGVMGSETEVKFTNKEKPVKGRWKVVEAGSVQPSHIGGQNNPLHFITEAQPKDRTDKVSDAESDKIAANINPKEIIDGVTAYTGAPVVNSRGEVIQGNNRATALRKMGGYAESAARYKQYLIDHAADYGLNAEDIAKMQNPVMVREVDVTDEEVIRLGQFTASDTESGGKERISADKVLGKLTDEQTASVLNIMLRGGEETDETLMQLIDRNGADVLTYLAGQGAINDTQVQSAYGRDGRMTPEAKNDLADMVTQNIFKGGADNIKKVWNEYLPVAAQKALLQAMAGDMMLPVEDRLIKEVRNAIMAVGEMKNNPFTKDAKTAEEYHKGLDMDARQADMLSRPIKERYSELELYIAVDILLTKKQNAIKAIFGDYQRLFLEKGADLFEAPKEYTPEEAIEKVFGIKLNKIDNNEQGTDTGGSHETGTSETGETAGNGELGRGERQTEGEPGADTGAAAGQPGTAEQSQQPAVNPANAPTEEEYAEIKAYLDEHPNASVSELQRKLKLGYNKAEIGKQRWENERVTAQGATPAEQPKSGRTRRTFKKGEKKSVEQLFEEEKAKYVGKESEGNEYAEVLAMSETVADAVSEFNRRADAALKEADDWRNRTYKPNNAIVEGQNGADEYTTTIGAANERRRENNIKRLEDRARELQGYAETLKERTGYTPAAEQTEETAEGEKPTPTKETPKQEPKAEKEEAAEQPRVAVGEGENKKPEKGGKVEKVKNEAAPKQKIDDVGEKIGGARKDLAQKMGAKINLDADTFPKMFPKFDLKKAVEQGLDPKLASSVYFLRIAAQKEYKSWLKHSTKGKALSAAKFFAAYAKQFLENGNTSTDFKDNRWTFTEYGKKHIEYNLALYEKVYEKFGNTLFDLDLTGYEIIPIEKRSGSHYFRKNEKGESEEYQPAYNARSVYSSKYYVEGELDKAIDELVNRMAESVSYKESHPYKLSHYYTPGVANSHYVGVKLGGKVVALTEKMGDKETSKYLKEHEAELQEKAKRLDEERKQGKQGGTNTKWKPELGLGGGRARVGNDYRNGKDVSAEKFRDTFGFRGVEFGNYVTQAERQRFINEAYDAMMDLAALLNVSPRALSLGGQLGFAIGARGGGNAMAHYEPELNVINLTKSKGAGSLAHEWWHALDYYFNRMGDRRKTPATANRRAEDFNPGQRREMEDAFVSLMEKINSSDYRKRSVALDAALNKDYYTNPTELGARAFQDYVQRRLTDRGQINDFLSSFTPEEQWNGKAETYPYPTGKEADVIDEKFDSLFGTMLEREDEQGNVMLYERADGKAARVSAKERKLRDAIVDLLRKAGIDVVIDEEAWQRVQNEEDKKPMLTKSGEAYGFTMGGKIYLDPKIATAETPIHEYTHLWAAALRAANPKAWERLKSELEKDKDLMAYVQRLYPELKGDELMDEVFAHFSGKRGAERLRAEQERMEGETRSIVGKAKVIAMFENLRDALKKFWNAARELFAGKSVKNESAEDFADMVLADLVSGFNPTENKKGEQRSHINPRSSVPNVRGGWNEEK